ncbi:MAG: flagellar hook basal-body protein [Planctomycetes bacterium]|nr:flagellar hook basal-body protein [Planctomycetota bacterium]
MNGLYTAASALDSFRVRQEAIAHNLANTQTVGFKRVSVRTQSFAQTLDGAMSGQVEAKAEVDFTQGDLVHTGEPLDLGLDGEGFFAVDTPNGVRYTRAGALRRDPQGRLVTASGEPLQSAGGGPLKLGDAPLSEIKVLADGRVLTPGGAEGESPRLKVVLLEGPGALQPDGASLYKAGPEQIEVASEALVQQGYRERSNAEPVQELLSMIEVHRMFESATQSIQAATRALERTSSEVL